MSIHARTFNRIYENNIWQFGSGVGSLPKYTEQYRWFLHNFIRYNNIRSVLDIGCGDWQVSSLVDWAGIDYTGIDVSSVVLSNTATFARPGIKFFELDAIDENLPVADLAIIKDVMIHWSNADIIKFIPKLSHFKKALITNSCLYEDCPVNGDILVGNFRPLDLSADPFNLNGNHVFFYMADAPKSVFLWTR